MHFQKSQTAVLSLMVIFLAGSLSAYTGSNYDGTYVDAAAGNTVALDGTSPWYGTSTSADGLWLYRSPYANNDTIYSGKSYGNDAPLLKTTISGLTPGQAYEIDVVYWSADNASWKIWAGVDAQTLMLYDVTNGTQTGGREDNRDEYMGLAGTVTADEFGQVEVFVDNFINSSDSYRTWYDGVVYRQVDSFCEGLPGYDLTGDCVVDIDDLVIICDQWLLNEDDIVSAPGEDFSDVTSNGAWCWFADPRGLYQTAYDTSYISWVTNGGDIQIAALDHATDATAIATVHAALEADDHANPSVMLHPDGRIMVFYAKHNDNRIRLKVSINPGDITSWGPMLEFNLNNDASWAHSYPNPYMLSNENDRIYMFWRGIDWHPTMSYSDDYGQTWSVREKVIQGPGGDRPYVKYDSDGLVKIHIAFTNGHPRTQPNNNIYYMCYENGAFYKADGTLIGTMNDIPILPSQADLVYDAAAQGARAWIWDVAFDSSGYPVLVYAAMPTETDHRYRYARWDGTQWNDAEMTAAGPWFPQTPDGTTEPEPHYSAGVILDHNDTDIVYLSRQVNGVFEIEKWVTGNGGTSWTSESLTVNSQKNNVRPFVIRDHRADDPGLYWMHGDYIHYYQNYSTGIKRYKATLMGDIANDGQVNLKDLGLIGANWLECNLVPQSECYQ